MSREFIVETCGITLKGLLRVDYSGNTRTIPFELPVSISYEQSRADLKLHVEETIRNVTVLAAGESKILGSVDLAPYFDTFLTLSKTFDTLESQTVSGRVEQVNVQYFNGSVKITGNINF